MLKKLLILLMLFAVVSLGYTEMMAAEAGVDVCPEGQKSVVIGNEPALRHPPDVVTNTVPTQADVSDGSLTLSGSYDEGPEDDLAQVVYLCQEVRHPTRVEMSVAQANALEAAKNDARIWRTATIILMATILLMIIIMFTPSGARS